MKISVSSYSFRQLLDSGELNQLSCIAVAKEMGFDGIEFVDILPHDGSSRTEYAKKLAEECKKHNLPVTSYTFGADLLNGRDDRTPAEEIQHVKNEIEFAVILGAPRVRHDATWGIKGDERKYKGFDDILPIIADRCREITEYAATKGVKTMVENHGLFAQDSQRVMKLVNAVAHSNFSLLSDMGNFMCADEHPAKAIGNVAPYVEYAHAKDFHVISGMQPNPGEGFFTSRAGNYLRGAIIGHGQVPVKQCLSILKREGYDGFVAIEFEGLENPRIGLKIGLANLRRFMKEIED